jgi:hypothetical protein
MIMKLTNQPCVPKWEQEDIKIKNGENAACEMFEGTCLKLLIQGRNASTISTVQRPE